MLILAIIEEQAELLDKIAPKVRECDNINAQVQ